MAKEFDAALNTLIGTLPEDWARVFAELAGIPLGPIEIVDTDLATSLQADRIFHVKGRRPSLLHLELEANPRLGTSRIVAV